MTDKTDIAALRPSERAKLGFVTDDNTGGYYVAECEECGQIFPSQNAEGGGPIADSGDYDDCYCPHCGHVDPEECDNANLVWNVQQLKIITLTSQLEAERQLTCEMTEQYLDRNAALTSATLRYEKAEAELAALRGAQEPVAVFEDVNLPAGLGGGNTVDVRWCNRNLPAGTELFTHPASPVVVLSDCDIAAVSHMAHWYTEEQCEAWVAGVEHAKKQMIAAGIVVKDEENPQCDKCGGRGAYHCPQMRGTVECECGIVVKDGE